MRHGSLFNGIGGFQLAAHWMGWTNVWHCEIDKFCNQVVKQHFPESICYEDIKQFDAREWEGKIDIISGGEPCQPHSVAGRQGGKEDARYLWPQYLRIAGEVQPKWIVNENVPGTISNGVLDQKISDLESIGYACWPPLIIPASAVGADHKRNRVWLIAHAVRELHGYRYSGESEIFQEGVKEEERVGKSISDHFPWDVKPRMDRVAYGIPNRVDRIKALGNAIVPQIAYAIFHSLTQTMKNE